MIKLFLDSMGDFTGFKKNFGEFEVNVMFLLIL